ncbi:3'(2'),5'-bisphosphate nucleotidase CysQ [Candidatus Nitrosacidococcus tergens]|uniref:3'(2'),5'-bisphosphate nucleotidase CysQ n=1 Tax=Candidatus Nitrosacidococcus tergens TaxID=553981 RepID=A0A7G1Q823_9GAMM|nr:3'(2'),5'-bisphosphate nucleotidase CysQ [Candidatus Nitrosacidococcus tergens]CAB1274708.1 3'(2'),5'-bisphosphate nucleotidase CysQ [Candidatus Nitrosacidococcus tergens]
MFLNISTQFIDSIIDISELAGEKILTIYRKGFTVAHKKDYSPLTEADLMAHKTIVQRLKSLFPDIPILSEESKKIPFSERSTWQKYWLVDPLDGTKEFIKGNGEFTVNIALIENNQPILGVVYAPALDQLYYAAKGYGAYRRKKGKITGLKTKSRTEGVPVQVVGSRSHGDSYLKAFLLDIGEYHLIAMGSSLKFCLVAEGKADIYPRFGLTSEWDTGAAQCIVEESGGSVIDLKGEVLRYNTKDSLLNPYFLTVATDSNYWQQFISDDIKNNNNI